MIHWRQVALTIVLGAGLAVYLVVTAIRSRIGRVVVVLVCLALAGCAAATIFDEARTKSEALLGNAPGPSSYGDVDPAWMELVTPRPAPATWSRTTPD